MLAFYAAGCDPLFVTTQEQAAVAVEKALENRRAGAIYGVVRGGIPGLTDDGYVMAVRRPNGNVGNFWYLSIDGRIVGVRNACGVYATIPGAEFKDWIVSYGDGPCFLGCKTPTPSP